MDRQSRSGLRWSLLGVFAAGVMLITASVVISGPAGWDRLNHVVQDVARDLGIAFIVSSVVAVLFELYRSLHHQIESMKDVVDAIMTDKLTKEVWFELEDLIDNKTVLRKDLRIRIEARNVNELRPDQAQLRVEMEYLLRCIGKQNGPITIRHDLDYQLAQPDLKLPRFDHVAIVRMEHSDSIARLIEETVYDRDKLTESNARGYFEIKPGTLRSDEYLRIRVTREEIVNVPGSYNLYTTEFTKGLRVLIARCPEATRAELWVRPQGEEKQMTPAGNEWWTEQLILPGQGVELKFLASGAGAACGESTRVTEPPLSS